MTENDAIKIMEMQKQCIEKMLSGNCKINCVECKYWDLPSYRAKACEIAIYALQEVQWYREIGTVEECREAVKKKREYDLYY